jgi:hypothetical protein
MTFDEVLSAPSDSLAYTSDQPVPVALNTVYVVRTSQYTSAFGQRCSFYSKLEPLDVDPENGVVRFVVETNPICNALGLVPTDG